MTSLRPIFVGGCERSGTTLLGALLGAAPGAVTVPESLFREAAVRALARGLPAAEAMRRMVEHERFGPWRTPEPLERVPADADLRALMEILVRRYARAHGATAPAVWVDHSPLNMRLGAALAREFPDARFVHIVRDGRGVANSVVPLRWGPNTIPDAARYWMARTAYGLALETSALADRIARVRYEALLADPEPEIRRLCAHLGLEFAPAMLAGGRFDVPNVTRRQHALVGKAPDATRASAWEDALSDREVEMFESVAGEMLDLLGYPLRHGSLAHAPRRGERLRLAAIEAFQRSVNRRAQRARLSQSRPRG